MLNIKKKEGWFTLKEKRPEDGDNIVFYTIYTKYGKHILEHGSVYEDYVYQTNSTEEAIEHIYIWTYDVTFEIDDD
jgi:hypothetical protein